jgi:hypothetical protein
MTLSTIDLNYINERIDAYAIKYQEVYDEIKDHVLSAVEAARANGDQRNIASVFDDLMEAHFPGLWPFEKISKQYEKAFRTKIRKAFWSNIRYYLNWQTIPAFALLIIAGFYLPHNKSLNTVFVIVLLVIAFSTQIYSLIISWRLKASQKKISLVKNHVLIRSMFLMIITNLLVNGVGFAARELNISFLDPKYYHPVIYMMLLCFFIIYGLSSMRLCRQSFKIAA